VTLKVSIRDVGDVRILELDGRLVLGDDSKSFRERVKILVQAGKKKIVLNLSNLSYIDSSGIAVLCRILHKGLRSRTRRHRRLSHRGD